MRFLMIYPNNTGWARAPLGIVYLLTILQEQGHEVRLFDMTFYGVDLDKHHGHRRAKRLNFRPVDLTPYGVTHKRSTMEEVKSDLLEVIKQFEPDVTGMSITEDTCLVGFELADAVRTTSQSRIIFGGVFCMAEPETVITHPSADIVCIGEGEIALPELLHNLECGKSITGIEGLWVKAEDGTIVRNPVAPPLDLDKLPFPDLSLIDDRHFYLPMAGHAYKMVHLSSQRGCPRRCTYCCNQLFLNAYKTHIREYLGRRMSIPRFIDNLVHLKDNFDFNFFQIMDEDFLLRSLEDIKHFHALYKEQVGLPFWIQAEANHVTEDKIRYLRDAGCVAIAIGIEAGNDFIREQVYRRPTSKEATLRAFQIMHNHGIRTSGNVIVGAPHEGRREIFESIDLVRKCQPRALNVNVLAPYRGTELREYCVEKGYLDKDYICDGRVPWNAVLDMPQITKAETDGLVRTFALYATLPREYWPMIQQCEDATEESDRIFADLESIYWGIAEERGMNFDVPGFDYDAFLRKRRKELADRTNKRQR
jgi:anaerobic magnesium-protoporphyrin IX monomethyl ester cyclase